MAFAENYLTDTRSFPPPDKQPWGENRISVRLAGLQFHYSGLDDRQVQQIRERFRGFTVDGSRGQNSVVETRVCRVDKALFHDIDFGGGHYTFDQDYRSDVLCLAGQYFMANIPHGCYGPVSLWTATNDRAYFMFIFENLFRVIAAYHVLTAGGLIMHSACIAKDGVARLMLGRSGAGKSTISRLSLDAGWEVLSDDMNAVFRRNGKWVVERLPFAGDLGQTPVRSNTYPLAGVYILSKRDINDIRGADRSRMLAMGLACAPTVNGDPQCFDSVISRLEALVTENDTGIVEFTLDDTVLKQLECR